MYALPRSFLEKKIISSLFLLFNLPLLLHDWNKSFDMLILFRLFKPVKDTGKILITDACVKKKITAITVLNCPTLVLILCLYKFSLLACQCNCAGVVERDIDNKYRRERKTFSHCMYFNFPNPGN